jgi:hypothetical protein
MFSSCISPLQQVQLVLFTLHLRLSGALPKMRELDD